MFGESGGEAVEAASLRATIVTRSIADTVSQVEGLLVPLPHAEVATGATPPELVPQLELVKRFAPQTDWLAGVSPTVAEEFNVPLAVAQLAPLHPPGASSSGHGLADRVLLAGKPIMIADAKLNKEAADDAFLVENGYRSFLGVPLKMPSGEVVGTVLLYDTDARDFTPDLSGLILKAAALVSDLQTRTAGTQVPGTSANGAAALQRTAAAPFVDTTIGERR